MIWWNIFKTSIFLIIFNFTDALKISGFLYLLSVIFNFVLSYLFFGRIYYDLSSIPLAESENPGKYFLFFLLTLVVSMVVASWIAVRWHRFILRSEYPKSLLPNWNGGLIWAYIKKGLLIAAVIVCIAVPFSIVFGIVIKFLSISLPLLVFAMLAWTSIILYISFRISLILPSVAVDDPLAIMQSWDATAKAKKSIWALAIMQTLIATLQDYLAKLVVIDGAVYALVTSVFFWISMMIGLSVLTTLYGYLVEKRELAPSSSV